MLSSLKIVSRIVTFLSLLSLSGLAFAQSPTHSYINTMRSSSVTHYYIGIGAEGYYGQFSTSKSSGAKAASVGSETDSSTSYPDKAYWQGHGIRNELGVEFIKFLQFNVAHSSLNLHSKHDSSERLFGSRFEGGGRLTFYAPLGNLQMDGGFLMSRLDYINKDVSSDYYGSGYYYGLGYNYFMNTQISITASARRSNEHLVKNSGAGKNGSFDSEMTSLSLGFNIWL